MNNAALKTGRQTGGATLSIEAGQSTTAGIKAENEDCIGLRIPGGSLLEIKGMAAVIADGVSSAGGGKVASECAVQGFLADYYSTPDPWSVKQSAHKVLSAINHWLYAEGSRRHVGRHGMLTTFSALILKSASAHLFHIGDGRIYRLRDDRLEQLTQDHRLQLSGERSYLSRALGADLHVEIDYQQLAVEAGDAFLLVTDGVTETLSDAELRAELVTPAAPEAICQVLCRRAVEKGSRDNVSCQLIRAMAVPSMSADDFYHRLSSLPFPPPLAPGMRLDGYRILDEMHASARSQVYRAMEEASGRIVALKTPSSNYADDPGYIEAFLQEEWIGRRVDHVNVVKVLDSPADRQFMHYATELAGGHTLQHWMSEHPAAQLAQVQSIVEQIAAALQAFHRLETVHRDLKPDNIVMNGAGQLKLIDFGSAHIAAFAEMSRPPRERHPPGTREYRAPELMSGYSGDSRSDQFSLATIAYRLLTGALPYPDRRDERLGEYCPASKIRADMPVWVDYALRKALASNPADRYEHLSEFIYDLAHPNPAFMSAQRAPLLERDPVKVWKAATLAFALLSAYLAYRLHGT